MTRMLTVALAISLCSCQTSWQKYPMSLYAALKDETPQAIASHHELLGDIYDKARTRGDKPPAGIAAEYAYYSWLLGKPTLAKEAMAVERASYPESAKFCELLERYAEGITPLQDVQAEQGGTQ